MHDRWLDLSIPLYFTTPPHPTLLRELLHLFSFSPKCGTMNLIKWVFLHVAIISPRRKYRSEVRVVCCSVLDLSMLHIKYESRHARLAKAEESNMASLASF